MIRKMDRQALIFLHIPKTVGTTLNQIIEWQCGPLSIFTLDPYRIRATAKRFKMLSEQHRPRFGGGVLVLVFYLAQAASLAPPQIEKRALGVEDYLRLIFHRQRFQCRLVTGVEGTAIGDERLPDTAKDVAGGLRSNLLVRSNATAQLLQTCQSDFLCAFRCYRRSDANLR